MATPTIPNGEEHFFPIIYEGNGGGQRVGKFAPFTDSGTIANSCIFDGSGHYLNKTFSGAGNRQTWTWSGWLKKTSMGGDRFDFFSGGTGSSDTTVLELQFQGDNIRITGYNTVYLKTNRTFKDSSKFYHILVAFDSTQGTATDRMKLYVDGDEITSFSTDNRSSISQNTDYGINQASSHTIGRYSGSANFYLNGYLAEVNFVDGTAHTPSTFGVTDTSSGRWIPKTLTGITYGTNGFRLQFGTGSAMGDDTANSNDFSLNNIDATNQTTDSPTQNIMIFTQNGQVGSNTLSQGNLKPTFPSGTGASAIPSTFKIPVGKWYFEYYISAANQVLIMMAVAPENTNFSARMHTLSGFKTYYPYTRSIYEGGSILFDGTDMPIGETDVTVGFYIERKENGTVNYWIGDDQASKGTFAYSFSGNPVTGANPIESSFTRDRSLKLFTGSDGNGSDGSGIRGTFNFGQLKESPIDSGTTLTDYTSTAGGFFRYQPADGFKALNQDNLPEASEGVSGLVWMKNRDASDKHQLYDSSRGKQKVIDSNNSTIETTVADGLQKFLKGGQQIEDSDAINTSGESFISWNWVGNNATVVDNNEGSITSSVQVNSTAGFSIIRFTGTNSAATVGHGLSVAPEWVISKNLDDTANWAVYHKDLTSYAKTLFLSDNRAETSSTTMWDSKATTEDVINISSNFATNGSSDRMVMYAWHSVDGFSKFGKYSGNSDSDGTFVYTGFKPAWLMVKKLSGSGNWVIMDSTRSPINPVATFFNADGDSEVTTATRQTDLLSNGFKFRGANAATNASGTYVYFAFAEHPFIGSQTLKGFSPVTAR